MFGSSGSAALKASARCLCHHFGRIEDRIGARSIEQHDSAVDSDQPHSHVSRILAKRCIAEHLRGFDRGRPRSSVGWRHSAGTRTAGRPGRSAAASPAPRSSPLWFRRPDMQDRPAAGDHEADMLLGHPAGRVVTDSQDVHAQAVDVDGERRSGRRRRRPETGGGKTRRHLAWRAAQLHPMNADRPALCRRCCATASALRWSSCQWVIRIGIHPIVRRAGLLEADALVRR